MLVFVQTREFDARLSVEPAGIMPSARSEPPDVRVTVLPLDVVPVVGAREGVVRTGVRTTGLLDDDVLGAVAAGAGATVVPAGTSLSAG